MGIEDPPQQRVLIEPPRQPAVKKIAEGRGREYRKPQPKPGQAVDKERADKDGHHDNA